MRRRSLRAALSVAAIGATAVAGLSVPGGAAVASTAVSVDRLEINASPSPLGIDDATPTFSWILRSGQRGVQQRKYRLVVATTAAKAAAGKGDVWDSGTISSGDTTVDYSGRKALKARTRYYWSVQAQAPGSTRWAAPAWFETAYLNASDWRGQWIAGEPRPVTVPTTAEGAADDACCIQANTTLAEPAAAGAGNVKVASISALATGGSITIGTAAAAQTVTIRSVGTAATSTTLAASTAAGGTTLYVASIAGFTTGAPITVAGQTATVTTVGTAQGQQRTLAAPAETGATTLKVNSVNGFAVGTPVLIGAGDAAQIRVVSAVGTAGETGTGITLNEPLSAAAATGTTVRSLGTGIQITPALTATAAAGAAVSSPGTGVTITPALTTAQPAGAPLVGNSTPTEICRPAGGSPNAGSCKPIRPTYLMRKSFDVAPVTRHGSVVSARLYSVGLGWNQPTVNGQKPDPDAYLNPGFTDYEDTVQYTTDDVTKLIQQDRWSPKTNVVATELGAGRYDSESQPSNHRFETAQWRNLETLRADLWVRYADGTEQLIKSDNTWKTSVDGPTRYNDFDTGETYDARRKLTGWNQAGYADKAWTNTRTVTGPAGDLIAQQTEATVKIADHNGPFPRWSPATGVHAFDTGRQRTGWATVKIWGAAKGQVIRIVYVERRNDDTTKDDPAIPGTGQDGALQLAGNLQQEYYVSDGTGTEANPETYAPNWNFAGFQWVQIDGSGGAALPDNVKVDVASVQELRTGFREIGTFESSVPLLNQIYANVRGSVAGDWLAGYSMDTPTYEKDGWTGDAQIILPTVANIFDIQRSMRKSARDAVDSQLANGQVGLLIPGAQGYGYCSPTDPAVDPNDYTPCGNAPSLNVFKPDGGGATPIWDAFLQVVPAEGYLRYADLEPIRTAYDAMTKYMDRNIQGGKPYEQGPGGWFVWDGSNDWTLNSGLGDWAFVTGAEGNAAEGTNLNVGGFQAASSTAFTAYLATKTAEAAKLLYADTRNPRYLRDAKQYETLFQNIRRDFNARWWDATRGFYAENTTQELRQGFQAWAIGFGLVEEKNKRALQEKLAYDVAVTRTGHAMIGFVGIRWIWPVLTEAAHAGVPYAKEALFKVAQQTTYPSYGYHIGLGYTGVGEYWESTTRTRNHQFQGSIGQWFYEELAGIKPAAAGYSKITIQPLPGGQYGVDHVAASVDTVHGLVKSSWTQATDGSLRLDVTIPANTTATIHVPAASKGNVSEGNRPAHQVAGIHHLGHQQDAEVYRVGSGTYSFRVTAG
ncbi:family 78 glycoside hydrolase catalytic domain [Actinoplanes sp. CA-131856]